MTATARIRRKTAARPASAEYEVLEDAWIAGRRVRKGETVTLPVSAVKYLRCVRPAQDPAAAPAPGPARKTTAKG